MSQKHLNSTKQYQQAYQPLPTTVSDTMNNSGLDMNDETEAMRTNLPPTYSSQQLMPSSSESDSFTENPDNGGRSTSRHATNARCNILSQMLRIARSKEATVIVLCFVNLINYMDRFTIAGVLTEIQDDFQIGDAGGGFLQTAFVISYMIFAPLFGYFGDRYSRLWIMGIGVFLWSTTTLLGSFMTNFYWFVTFRALVGIGEASYSTIAPTIISDLFVSNIRSKMLAVFYFAIPVGSGLGYIIGSETAHLAGNWRWALRVTPFLGIVACVFIAMIKDPERGESEGGHSLQATSYCDDIKDLMKNRSFMLSTCGFTCVSFVAGALAWWGPKFIHLGIMMQPGSENVKQNDVSYKFGIIAMIAGLLGVPSGSYLAQRYRPTIENCDAYICAIGMLVSAPFIYLALITPQTSAALCFTFVFLAQIFLNLCWSIVADILLYVVVPTRRSTAEAVQILLSHAFGDACSPYIVGLLSEAIKTKLRTASSKTIEVVSAGAQSFKSLSLTLEGEAAASDFITTTLLPNATNILSTEQATEFTIDYSNSTDLLNLRDTMDLYQDTNAVKFEALQYALFSTCFVEVLGGIFFLITAAFIIRDKQRAQDMTRGGPSAGNVPAPANE